MTTLATALKVEMVNISHHLQVMQTAGVLTSRKDGRFVIYTLAGVEAIDATAVTLKGPGVSVTIDL